MGPRGCSDSVCDGAGVGVIVGVGKGVGVAAGVGVPVGASVGVTIGVDKGPHATQQIPANRAIRPTKIGVRF